MNPEPPTSSSGRGRRSAVIKLLIFAAFAGAFAYVFVAHRDELTLKSFAAREARLREFQENHPVGVYIAAFAIYVAVTGLSIPGATVLTLFYAWFFKEIHGSAAGFAVTVAIVSFASTSGATVAFLLSRYLLRDAVRRRFPAQLRRFDAALERDGVFYLFTLRLTPVVPFWVINLVMGLTPIRVWTFWWVSQVGTLAGTCVYVYAGTQIPSARDLADAGLGGILTLEIIAAFMLLGLCPLVTKKLLQKRVES